MSDIKPIKRTEIRTNWDSEKEQWLFSVIDVIEILTDSSIPKRYWSDLKQKLQKESGKAYENIVRLKMEASDGRLRETDVADSETLLRIIQSIPSPKAEPFKQWLAKAGSERMKSFSDPEQSFDLGSENWQKPGTGEMLIHQRATGRETQNKPDASTKNNQLDWGED